MIILYLLLIVFIAVSILSQLYVVFASYSISRLPDKPMGASAYLPPVTILKPLCGLDPGLYENLCSFCDQDYPQYQIIFGVRSDTDPAIAIVQRVMSERPERDIALIVNSHISGSNYKVSNLINMQSTIKYDLILIADSDMRVDKNYLTAVVAPFQDATVGAVTCLYRGVPVGGLVSKLSTMAINEDFLPSVLVALRFSPLDFCFGATMAVRQDVLRRIGGLEILASQLADDHLLGKLVCEAGYTVRLAPYLVDNIVLEDNFKTAFRHELRWARTIFSLAPVGYIFSFLKYAVPISLLAVVLSILTSQYTGWSCCLFALSLSVRMFLYLVVYLRLKISGEPFQPWLAPIRDILGMVVWMGSFFGRNVSWREQSFTIERNGQIAVID